MGRLLGAIELGGTKVRVAIGTDPLKPLRTARIPTEDPATTLAAVESFFAEAREEFGAAEAVGVGAFGPVEIRRGSANWGHLGSTPKLAWQRYDLAGSLGRIGYPIALDTDVNAAALAEARWGAGRGLGTIIYLTVGTGIGGGIVVDGRPLHGALHPEIGHVRLKRHRGDDAPSRCPYHDDCAEGLAAGPAVAARFGNTLAELGDHPFRAMLADYLGQLCANLVLVVSPERIVIGGGVMGGSGLHGEVDSAMRRWLNGYAEPSAKDAGGFIVPPGLGEDSGLAGAFALAEELAGA